jgi:hypothetical protein
MGTDGKRNELRNLQRQQIWIAREIDIIGSQAPKEEPLSPARGEGKETGWRERGKRAAKYALSFLNALGKLIRTWDPR